MQVDQLICILLALQLKHFVVDFCWQAPYMWKNKGNLLHLGGYVHAGLHAVVSTPIFYVVGLLTGHIDLVLSAILLEFVLHYAIDFAKINSNRMLGLTPNDSSFWVLLGFDQFLHQVSYIAIIMLLL